MPYPPPAPGPPTSPAFTSPTPTSPTFTPPTFSSELLLKWSGLVLVVLAGLFLVGTAVNRGWIGPELQLVGAVVLGVGLIAGGFRLAATSVGWSRSLSLGGVVVLVLSAVGANTGLDLVRPGTALFLVAVVFAAMLVVARRLRYQSVATVAAVTGILFPLGMLAGSDLPDLVVAGWVSAVVVVVTVVGLISRWPILRLVGSVVGALTLLGLAVEVGGGLGQMEQALAFAMLAAVGLAIWIGPSLATKFGAHYGGMLLSLDHRSVLYLPSWSFAVVAALGDFDSRRVAGAVGLLLTAGYLVAALLAAPTVARRLYASHVLAAGTLLSVSLAVLTDSPALLVAISIQAVGTAYLGRRFNDVMLKVNAAALGVVALLWSGISITGGWLETLDLGDHLGNLVVVLLIIGAAVLARWEAVARGDGVDDLSRPLTVIGWAWALGWLAAVLIHSAQGQVLVSIVWATAAAGAIVYAVKRDDGLVRVLGLTTLIIVLAKLLTIDLAAVDTLWRVGLFFVIGAGLLRLGYLLPRFSTPTNANATESSPAESG